MKHRSMTKEQREILDQDLRKIMENLGDIGKLLNACYGDDDPRVERAAEGQAAVQRLVWALDRNPQTFISGSTAAFAQVRDGAKASGRFEVIRAR